MLFGKQNAAPVAKHYLVKERLADRTGKIMQELLQGTVYVLEKKGVGIEVSEELLRKAESPDVIPLLKSLNLQIGLVQEDRDIDVGIKEWIVMGPNWTRDQWKIDREAEEAAQSIVEKETDTVLQTMEKDESEGQDDVDSYDVHEGKHDPPDALDPREPVPKARKPKLQPKEILKILQNIQENEVSRAADSVLVRAQLIDLEARHLDLETREAGSAIVRARLVDLEARHLDLQMRTSDYQQRVNSEQGSPPAYKEEISEGDEDAQEVVPDIEEQVPNGVWDVGDGSLRWGPPTERDLVKRGKVPS